VRPLVDYRNLVLDPQRRTVRFTRPGVEIDLGGIGKGFAVELAAGVLRKHGLAGLVDAGGNQHVVGHPPGRSAWSVGIQDPRNPGRVLGVLDLPSGSLSTSGAYASFLTIDGRRYGHILDPRTLRPSEAASSVTVVGRDGTLVDALSTAAFVLGPDRALGFIESFPGAAGIVAWPRADGSLGVTMSSSLRSAFHPEPAR
jgi:thiamine biosynthesis lipoprotein